MAAKEGHARIRNAIWNSAATRLLLFAGIQVARPRPRHFTRRSTVSAPSVTNMRNQLPSRRRFASCEDMPAAKKGSRHRDHARAWLFGNRTIEDQGNDEKKSKQDWRDQCTPGLHRIANGQGQSKGLALPERHLTKASQSPRGIRSP